METSALIWPLVIAILLFSNPCTPPLIWSMNVDCETMKWKESSFIYFLWIITIFFESWIVFNVSYGGSTWFFYAFATCVVCLLEYFEILKG
jgi:hypothetical protein